MPSKPTLLPQRISNPLWRAKHRVDVRAGMPDPAREAREARQRQLSARKPAASEPEPRLVAGGGGGGGSYTDENARDAIAAALTPGNLIDIAVNDGADSITIAVDPLTSADITDFAAAVDERARDALGTALTAGTGITVTPNDGTDQITVATTITQYTDEMARDALGSALVAGNNIDITVNDAGDSITIDVESLTSADITDFATAVDERARDAVGTALVAGAGITITPSDVANTITVASTITQYTDEMAQDAVGASLTDSSTINFTYTDGSNQITAALTAGLDDLNDTAIATPAQGQLLTYDASGGGQWVNADPQQGIMTLDDRTHAYVTQFGTTGTGNTNFDTPTGIGIDSSGDIFVADRANNRVKKHNSSGTYVTAQTSITDPGALHVSAVDDAIYFSRQNAVGDYRVRKYTADFASFVGDTANLGLSSGFGGITHANAFGGLYATNGSTVYRFNPSTLALFGSFGSSGSGDGQLDTAKGITTDGTYLYVCDSGNQRIQKFTLNGSYISQWGRSGSDPGEFGDPVAIHYNSVTGFLYVVDATRDDVQEFTTEGAFIGSFGAPGTGNGQFQTPAGIANDVAGSSVWVTDTTQDRLQKFTRSVTSEEATRVAFNVNDFIVSSTDGGETGFISIAHPNEIVTHDHTESSTGGILGPAALGVIGIYQDADYTGSNSSSAQKLFNESANGAANVAESTTYLMQASIYLRTTGTTSHDLSLLFGGTATLTSIGFVGSSARSTTADASATVAKFVGTAATATLISGAVATATHYFIEFSGIVRVNGAGTFIPQFKFSAAPGVAPVTGENSFLTLTPIGANTVTTVGSWS